MGKATILYITALSLLFIGCQNTNNNKDAQSNNQADSLQALLQTAENNSLMQDTISVEDFRKEGDINANDLKGEILKVLHTKDDFGHHYIALSQEVAGSYLNEGYEKQHYYNIYANSFDIDHGGLLKRWEFNDKGNEAYAPFFLTEFCHMADVDGDKRFEAFIVSSDVHDGLDGMEVKVVCYYKNKEYKTTMQYPDIEGDTAEDSIPEYRKVYASNFNELPLAVRDYIDNLMINIQQSMYV